MMAITSHRPFKDCPEEIIRHQIAARKSWEGAFEKIIYVGNVEPDLIGENVSFIPFDGKPEIWRLCQLCADWSGWSCIINADVILGPHWRFVEPELTRYRLQCAVSRRYELPLDGSLENARLVDLGMDWFAARPEIWGAAFASVPKDFCLGRILWDTWMLSFFMQESRGNCADVTLGRVIFHPKHGNRKDQHVDYRVNPFLDKVMWPGYQMGVDWSRRPLTGPKPFTGSGGGGTLSG